MSAVEERKGISTLDGLGLLFVGLKLTENVDWSWWYVTSPFWIELILIALVAFWVELRR